MATGTVPTDAQSRWVLLGSMTPIRIYVEEMENVCPSSRSDSSLRTTNALTPTLALFLRLAGLPSTFL